MLNVNKAIHTSLSVGQNQLQHKTGQTAFYQKLQVTAGQLALPELLFIIQQHQQNRVITYHLRMLTDRQL